MLTFYLDREGGAAGAGVGKSRGVGNPARGCPRLVPRRGAKGLVHAAACALALAAGQAHAATDGPALAQRAAEFIKQELRAHAQREAWERQREIEQWQLERIDAMDARERAAIDRHDRDLDAIPSRAPRPAYRGWRP